MISNELAEYSNRYGSNPDLVLAGGGNTSAKDGNTMYIKGSGTRLATIKPEEFVRMDRTKLAEVFTKSYPDDDKEREALSLKDVIDAMEPGQEGKRPSVETTLHSLFPQKFVLHLHPSLINGLTCSVGGEKEAKRLFGNDIIWVDPCRPGYVLAKICSELMKTFEAEHHKSADTMLLGNHGVFFAADNIAELGEKLEKMLSVLYAEIKTEPDFSTGTFVVEKSQAALKEISEVFPEDYVSTFEPSTAALKFAESEVSAAPLLKPMTPDHIVYCKAYPIYLEKVFDMKEKVAEYKEKNGYLPKILLIKDCGFFAVDSTQRGSETAAELFNDAMKIVTYAESFKGASPMSDELTDFIVHWEAEAYRSKKN